MLLFVRRPAEPAMWRRWKVDEGPIQFEFARVECGRRARSYGRSRRGANVRTIANRSQYAQDCHMNHPRPTRSLADRLAAAGLRLTAPRRAVATVLETSDAHLTSAEVFERAKPLCPDLGRATVYRTLETLARLGAIRPLALGVGVEQRFALADGGHHHLVCADCGTVVEFDDCPLGDLETALAARTGFQIHGHLLELLGRCPACR